MSTRRTLLGVLSLMAFIWVGPIGLTGTHAAEDRPASLTPAHCAATPLATAPFHRRDLAALPWITASPASTGFTGHLFFALLPQTRCVRVGRHDRAAVLYTGGAVPSRTHGAMKSLWVFANARAGDVLGPLTVEGRDLSGRGTTHQVFARSGTTDYPSIIDIPTPGCWQLRLRVSSLIATERRSVQR